MEPSHARPRSRTARRSARRDRAQRLADRLASLTGLRVRSAKADSLPRELLESCVPAPEVLLRELRDELEPRTHNALCQHEPGHPDEVWTVRRLLDIRGFGLHSLLDLLDVLASHGPGRPRQPPTPARK